MGGMHRYIAGLALAALPFIVVACGGGNGDENNVPSNPELTNPASVPSSTPIARDQVFGIGENGISAPSGASAPNPDGGGNSGGGSGGTYTVVSGDTCSSIAGLLGVSTEALLNANPEINDGCTNLQSGQVISVPGSSSGGSTSPDPTATPQPSGGGTTYTIVSGDTCEDIAIAHGVDTDELIALNGLDCTNLQIDAVIDIP